MTAPNFLIVGAAKAGTTTLYSLLGQHPQVFLPQAKEIQFFSNVNSLFASTIEDYFGLFSRASNYVAVGEVSPSYLYDPIAPKLIYEALGNVKIVIVLRDPVKRAFSNWVHNHNFGIEPLDFPDAIAAEASRINDPDFRQKCLSNNDQTFFYFSRGCYADQIKRYQEVFGSQNVEVILLDDIAQQFTETMKNLSFFLGIDPKFKFESVKSNQQPNFRSKKIARLFLNARQLRLDRIMHLFPVRLRIVIWQAFRKLVDLFLDGHKSGRRVRPESYKCALSNLYIRYSSELDALEDLLNRDFSNWRYLA